jgi:hypothetical protein
MVAANRTDHGVDNLQQPIERYHLGGVIYFAWSNNVNNPQQIAGLSNGVQEVATGSGAELPALVSTDQEGGIVAHVLEPATQFPGNMALGAARDPALANTAAAITGHRTLRTDLPTSAEHLRRLRSRCLPHALRQGGRARNAVDRTPARAGVEVPSREVRSHDDRNAGDRDKACT